VDHLVEHHDVVGGLEELHVLVVEAGGHRGPGVEPEDAAVECAAVGVRVGGVGLAVRAPLVGAALPLGGQGGDAAVRGATMSDVRRSSMTVVPKSSQKLL
jgi:hypothetical protein